MKKIITHLMALSLFLSIVTFTSCKEDPVDRQLDNMESMLAKVDKLSHEENPSREEIIDFKKDAIDLRQSLEAIQQSMAFTPLAKGDRLMVSQKKRFIELLQKEQKLYRDGNFERLQRFVKQYNLDY